MPIHSELLNEVRIRKEQEIKLTDFTSNKALINVALTYPSPYTIAMSSLGYQTIYNHFNQINGVNCERAFLPDNITLYKNKKTKIFTYESERELDKFDIVAFSIAYEIEFTGILDVLSLSNIPFLAEDRNQKYHPLIIGGGPITFSNPLPVGTFFDVILLGEAEELIDILIEQYKEIKDRKKLLEKLSEICGFYVPSIHKNNLPGIAKANTEKLPAHSVILTPNTELSNMFLIEAERGCSRGCTFCVMRRSTNNGMRIFPIDLILSKIPDKVKKVGLVGAAVSDHPKIVNLLEELVINRKKQIGISSLRADRLNARFVELLALGGYRTLTVASDGPSERLRALMEKRIKEKDIIKSAEFAKEFKLKYLKLYQMIGIPTETDNDIDELIDFTIKVSKITKTAMGISPFVPKKNTPLSDKEFEGIKSIEEKIKKINKALGKYIDVRTTSAKWAWIEYKLAKGSYETGFSIIKAHSMGANFSAWKNSFE